jgi:hypothetical protein
VSDFRSLSGLSTPLGNAIGQGEGERLRLVGFDEGPLALRAKKSPMERNVGDAGSKLQRHRMPAKCQGSE